MIHTSVYGVCKRAYCIHLDAIAWSVEHERRWQCASQTQVELKDEGNRSVPVRPLARERSNDVWKCIQHVQQTVFACLQLYTVINIYKLLVRGWSRPMSPMRGRCDVNY